MASINLWFAVLPADTAGIKAGKIEMLSGWLSRSPPLFPRWIRSRAVCTSFLVN